MSFNFGSGGTSKPGGFTFVNTTSTPAAGTTGFSFNATQGQTQAPASGGFNFGGTPQQPTPATTTAAASTGFSLAGLSGNSAAPSGQSSLGGGFSALGSGTTNTLGGMLGGAAATTTAAAKTTAAPGLGATTGFGTTATALGATTGFGTTGLGASTGLGSTGTGFQLGSLGGAKAAVTPASTTAGLTLAGAPTPAGSLPLGSVKPNTTAPAAGFTIGGTSGFSLGGSLTQNNSKPAATTAPATALGGGLLNASQTQQKPGGLGLITQQATAAAKVTAPATSATPGAGFKLGLTSTAATAGFSLGGNTATATPVTNLTTATSTTASANAPQSMNYRQLEEAINKWTLELEEQEKIFLQQATQVNAWDRLLIENGEKITNLNGDVERVKLDQQRLDQELDFILSQQKELEDLLSPLEKAMEQLPAISYQQHADLEREHTYQLSENVDAQLKRMVQDLKEIIEHLNTTNSNQDNSDPMQKISKILNAHMDSLQWIDQNTVVLQRRVEEVAKQAEQRRKEQEKNFRLAYD